MAQNSYDLTCKYAPIHLVHQICQQQQQQQQQHSFPTASGYGSWTWPILQEQIQSL